jgi:NAD(P)-dependent dehydrogenase (short-subunit alcohol dehydrogenase family)
MANSIFDLSGKTAIVTGSTRGIGKAIAAELGRAGANVVISSRKQEACREVAEEFSKEGLSVAPIACNISRKEELEHLVAETRKLFGKIDILICNAALNPYYGPMAGASDEVFTKVMGTNIQSNLWLCNMVCPEMAERGDGSIVIVSSIGGLKGSGTLGLYCISKAADFQLVRNLAVEWGPSNIRVNAIAPGLVRTDFAKALWDNPKLLASVEKSTPLRRIGEPEDIAGAAVYLSSRAGAWMTGQAIVVDGGVTIVGG